MFNKNKITLETRENKLEKIKKKSLRKTLFTTVMSVGVLLGCTGMLVGCGETGPKGDTGAQGPQGVAGADGSLWLTGTAAPLDTQGRDGDLYLNTTTYDIYLKSGLGWISIGNIQGGKGEQGNAGTPGVTPTVEINKDGYWVINGVATDQKAQGEAGATPTITIVDGNWYVNGEDTKVKAEAIDGTKGADGNTWAVGATAPTQANINDMFLNNTTWEVYKYNGTTWVSVGNIKGEQGEEGPQGETGADGTTWFTGIAVSGTGNGIGVAVENAKVGDLYFNTSTYDMYVCLAENIWGWMCNIKGEQGVAGTTPTVEINKDGYWVINGVPTDQKAQGEAGATPTITIVDGNWYVNGEDTKVKAEAIDGTKGADGNTWAVGATAPTQANTNDMFLNNTTWEVYKYNGTEWVSVGNIKGEQGQQGANGSSFLTYEGKPVETYGANGDVCLDTTTYDLYKKIDGTWSKIGNIKGAQGESGAQGDAGASGITWLSGAGEPALGIGAEGDFYLDTETCNIYIKGESGWAVAVNIKGEQGIQGETGVAGKDGATWLNGSTTPDNANGNNGDFYLDTVTCNIYVKSSNVWEFLCNIKGADGASGDSGSTTTSTIEIVDGNWVINGEDTGIKAEGEAGANGKSAYELYKEENPGYTGTLSEWLESLKGDAGNDGLTPYIKDGYWWIGDTNTEVSATPNTKIALTSDGQLSINGTIVDVDSNLTYENLKIVLDGYEIKKEVSASGKWAEGGSVEFNEAGYINSSGQVVSNNTWIHTDFIPLNRLNGSIGQFVGHAVVAHVAYYSGNSFTDFVSSKNISEFTGSVNDGYITYNAVLDNAPENAEYVVFSTNSANYSLTVDLTPSAESTLIYTISPKTDKDVIVGDRLMHFSFDDTIASLKDLTDNASTYTSIFDSPFFGALKEVHDEYGAVFSCYCFYEYDVDGSTETTDDTFTLADCTDAFASEFAANANWLRFGFHSRNGNTTYSATDVTAETALTDYNDTITQLLRITGSVKCIDTCIRTQSFTGNKEVCLALRDADCGVTGFLTGDYTETGENPNIDTSTGYYLSSEAATLCGKKGRYFDYENQLFFFPSNKRLDNTASSGITTYLELFNTADRYNRSHMMEMYAHENQMIKNITDYKLRLKYTAEWAVENGYEFGFTMDKINQMF